MKVIKLDETKPYSIPIYDFLDRWLRIGGDYLPSIFLKKVYLGGHVLHLPRWITKQHMDSIDKDVKRLMDDINWE